MEVIASRAKLVSFRALSFHGDNKGTANGHDEWSFELAQEIRDYLWEAGVRVDRVSRFLPRDQGWPEWDEFLTL